MAYEFEHHGILGQKWGVQNGPPYPLGAGDHSKSEQKAGWRKSLNRPGPISDDRKLRERSHGDEEARKREKQRVKLEKNINKWSKRVAAVGPDAVTLRGKKVSRGFLNRTMGEIAMSANWKNHLEDAMKAAKAAGFKVSKSDMKQTVVGNTVAHNIVGVLGAVSLTALGQPLYAPAAFAINYRPGVKANYDTYSLSDKNVEAK